MPFLRKYGVAAQVDGIPLITRGAVDYKANPTLAAGDVQISKDGGAFANIEGAGTFGDFVAVAPAAGTSVQVKPDAAALTCKKLVIRFIDQTSPKEWEDQLIIIETFGHASAQYTGDFNYLDASIAGLPAGLVVSLEAAGVMASLVTVADRIPLEYTRGDVKPISFSFGSQWAKAGSRVYFIAKASPTADNTTAVINRECTITDAANMVGSITPTTAESATTGSYYAEFERRDADGLANPATIWQGKWIVRQDVRQ